MPSRSRQPKPVAIPGQPTTGPAVVVVAGDGDRGKWSGGALHGVCGRRREAGSPLEAEDRWAEGAFEHALDERGDAGLVPIMRSPEADAERVLGGEGDLGGQAELAGGGEARPARPRGVEPQIDTGRIRAAVGGWLPPGRAVVGLAAAEGGPEAAAPWLVRLLPKIERGPCRAVLLGARAVNQQKAHHCGGACESPLPSHRSARWGPESRDVKGDFVGAGVCFATAVARGS